MTTENDLISVLLCVYNGEAYIEEALTSLIMQTYRNIEIIVCDDGSDDRTCDIVSAFVKKDERIKLFTKENTGLTKSLNYAIKLAKGDWIARQDADDISIITRLEKQLKYTKENDLSFTTSWCERFNEKGKIDKIPKIPNQIAFDIDLLKYGNVHTHGSFFMKKEIAQDYMYDEKCRYAQDYNLIMRLICGGVRCGIVDEVLYRLRIHNDSISNNKGSSQAINVVNTLKELNINSSYYIGQYKGMGKWFFSIRRKLYIFNKTKRIS